MAGAVHVSGAGAGRSRMYESHLAGRRIDMSKIMALSILAYLAVPVLLFFAADRAFDGNWSGVLGFLLDAAGCSVLARMITWASKNL